MGEQGYRVAKHRLEVAQANVLKAITSGNADTLDSFAELSDALEELRTARLILDSIQEMSVATNLPDCQGTSLTASPADSLKETS